MSVKPFLILAAAASFATPAFAQSGRCAANAVFAVTAAECQTYGGTLGANSCALSPENLSRAQDEICLSLPNGTQTLGNAGAVAASFGAVALFAAVIGDSSTSTTTTTTN